MKRATRPQKVLKNRLTAFAIDLLVIGIFQKVMMLTLKVAASNILLHAAANFQRELSSVTRNFELPLLLMCYFSYFFLCLTLGGGHTLGKLVMNLKVHRPHAPFEALTLSEAFMRTSGYTLGYLSLGLFFIFPLLNKKRRGLPDWMSGTIVSSEEELQEIRARTKVKLLALEGKEEEASNQLQLFPEDGEADFYQQKSA